MLCEQQQPQLEEQQQPRLERWRVVPDFVSPRERQKNGAVIIAGEVYGMRWKWPDGTQVEMAFEPEPVAAEGVIVRQSVLYFPLKLLLGAPASYDFLVKELYNAQVNIAKLETELRNTPSQPVPRPRGRAPSGCSWDGAARRARDGEQGLWRNAGERCASNHAFHAVRASSHGSLVVHVTGAQMAAN